MADQSPSLTRQAQGIVVGRTGCSSDEALMALTIAAHRNELTVDELAGCLVANQDLASA